MIKDLYSKKFPELEAVNLSALDYAKVVQLIGNKVDMSGIDLGSFLPSSIVLVISMSSTTSTGKPLSESDLARVLSYCASLMYLDSVKIKVKHTSIFLKIHFC
jgi:U4/U6 small nuclear ribonucleoprotein PRP31